MVQFASKLYAMPSAFLRGATGSYGDINWWRAAEPDGIGGSVCFSGYRTKALLAGSARPLGVRHGNGSFP